MKNYKIILIMILSLFITSCQTTGEEIINSPTPPKESEIKTLMNPSPTYPTNTVENNDCTITPKGDDAKGNILMNIEYTDSADEQNLYFYNLNNNSFRRLTEKKESMDIIASISPDGKRMVFVSDRNHRRHFGLFMMKIDDNPQNSTMELVDKPVELIYSKDYNVENPVWSSDGKWIAYVSRYKMNSYIDIINPDTMENRRINDKFAFNYYSIWSHKFERLYILNQNTDNEYGSTIDSINLNDILQNGPTSDIFTGKNIYVYNGMDINNNDEVLLSIEDGTNLGIFKMSLLDDNNLPIKIYGHENENAWGPIWSPDGKWIAFQSGIKDKSGINNELYYIYLYNDEEQKIYTVFFNTQSEEREILWSPDSKYLAYTVKEGDELYYIDIVSIDSIINNSMGCNNYPIKIGPINSIYLGIFSWIN